MKYIKGLFLSIIVCLSFSSCKEEVGLPDNGTPNNPEVASAGTYVGTWTRTSTTGEVLTADGSITLTADDRYVTTVTISCPDIEAIDNLSSRANISQNALGYGFLNRLTENGLATPFTGLITSDFVGTMNFRKTVRDGRKSVTYTFDFNGEKQ